MAECSGSVVPNNVNIQKQSSSVQSTDSTDEDKTDKVMEPILLEDLKYKEEPRSVINLLEFFKRTKLNPNKNDILGGLIYILMLESGFVPIKYKDSYENYSFNYQRLLKFSKQLPDNWKRGNVYNYSFVLPPFDIYECKVACVVMADDFLVNCVVKGVENGHFNTILDPLTYFTSSSTDMRIDKLQNMKYLSRLVKDEVCYPVKQAILRRNFIVESCFEELPPEIMLIIMSYLKVEDLVHLGQTCSLLYGLMKTPKLWVNLLRMNFDKCFSLQCYETLRNFYKESLEKKKRVRYRAIGYRYYRQ